MKNIFFLLRRPSCFRDLVAKSLLLLIGLFVLTCQLHSQVIPDSLMGEYKASKTIFQKLNVLGKCFERTLENDTIFAKKAIRLKTYLEKQNDVQGVAIITFFIANHAFQREQFATHLSVALPLLADCIERKDTAMLKLLYPIIAAAYERSNNNIEAANYWKKLIPIYKAEGNKKELALTNNYIASNYAARFMPDSGLLYSEISVKLANELKNDTVLTFSLSTLAENYIANKDYDLAMPFLRRSLVYAFSTGLDISNIAYIYNDFAQAFLGAEQYDSAIVYLHKSIPLAHSSRYKIQLARAYEYLSAIYEINGNSDSLNKYFRLAVIMRDSIESTDKIKAIQEVNFKEAMRQQETLAEKTKEEEERSQNIQYALLAMGILVFVSLFLLLSRSFITNTRLISFLGIVTLLIVFEFLNLLLHPFLEKVTHHSPLLMLSAMVCIAALLVPIHHKMETWTTKKLVEKNKAIRLAHAKKTIEELEEHDPK